MHQHITAQSLRKQLENKEQLMHTLKHLENRVTHDIVPVLIEILKTVDQAIRLVAKLIQLQPKEFNSQTLQVAIQRCLGSPINITLLKAIGALLQEFKIDTPDQFIRQVFRCCFTGIPQFGNLQPEHVVTDLSSDSEGQSDAAQKANSKIRSTSILVLKTLIKEFPLYFQSNWQLFLQKLLQLLQHEPRKNTKINLIQLIIILLDTLNVSKWIQGIEIVKHQHGFQPKAYVLFQGVKQIHETVLALLSGWKQNDTQFNIQLCKLEVYLMQECRILTKLQDSEGAIPLYQISLQLMNDATVKTSAMQILNFLVYEGIKTIDVRYLIKLCLQGIKDRNENNNNNNELFIQECYQLLQKCQSHFHKEFCELVNCQELQRIKQPNIQYYRIFEEISCVAEQGFQDILIDVALECLQSNAVELVPAGFNIIGNLQESFWQKQNKEVIEKMIKQISYIYVQLFSDTPFNMSSLKITFYKAIGTLCSSNSILQNPMAVQELSQMFNKLQGNNVHVLEKSSWAAANLSSLVNLNQEFYQLFLNFGMNNKEKISTNGLRGLGYYLMKCQQAIINQDLINCYANALSSKNPKISWNASTSLHNAVQGNCKELLENAKIRQSILDVLTKGDNLKAQMHCVELVKYLRNEYAKDYLRSLIQILVKFKNHDNFIEKKYQTRMRESVLFVLEVFFKRLSLDELINSLDDTLHEENALERVATEIYAAVLDRKPKDSQIIIANSDLSKQEVLQLQQNFKDDEKTFKQQQEHSYIINQYLSVPKEEEFQKFFQQMSFIATTLYNVIDESPSDKLISFSALEALQELSTDSSLIKIYSID
ncbi:unnamed protein product [Paramecium primaurelia]|uniref:Uncharacterized protein n=1 Tax=Paramecium primaurelia TaxID=5886 RepID=A0A8S1QER8_PARPR|nr:unnamed protein product [Paramecium primaurelia]